MMMLRGGGSEERSGASPPRLDRQECGFEWPTKNPCPGSGGNHLCLQRHDPGQEWVYNQHKCAGCGRYTNCQAYPRVQVESV